MHHTRSTCLLTTQHGNAWQCVHRDTMHLSTRRTPLYDCVCECAKWCLQHIILLKHSPASVWLSVPWCCVAPTGIVYRCLAPQPVPGNSIVTMWPNSVSISVLMVTLLIIQPGSVWPNAPMVPSRKVSTKRVLSSVPLIIMHIHWPMSVFNIVIIGDTLQTIQLGYVSVSARAILTIIHSLCQKNVW